MFHLVIFHMQSSYSSC